MGILFCVVQCILVAVVSVPVRAQATASYACGRGADKYRFCDQALSIETRVADVIASLTTEEKIGLLINDAADVPRLGIPKYEWWSEALHGVAYSPGVSFGPTILRATSFPQPILTSSSFNASLFNKIGQVPFHLCGSEYRAEQVKKMAQFVCPECSSQLGDKQSRSSHKSSPVQEPKPESKRRKR